MTQRGRPKTFDRDTALDAAMVLFWSRGFEQTSVDDLADAMGIRTSSLYSSFGDKETLFLDAIAHYRVGRGSVYDTSIAEGKTAKAGFENLFKVAAYELTRKDQPHGCMLLQALPTCSPKYDHLQEELDRLRALSENVMLKRLEGAVRNKEIPKSANLPLLVSYFRTTIMGMSQQARAGASEQTLRDIGKLALQIWPSAPEMAKKVSPRLRRS
jgi:AcrR family transcriptional regulator